MQKGDKVYLDTNVIIEAHRIRCWKALCNQFDLHTVAACKREALAGNPQQRGYVQVPEASLKTGITVHEVPKITVVGFSQAIDGQLFNVDRGDRELVAHVITGPDAWVLSGPDRASLLALKFYKFLDGR